MHSPAISDATDRSPGSPSSRRAGARAASCTTAAAEAASSADVAVVVIGYTAEDEGGYLGDTMLSSPEFKAVFPPPGVVMPTRESREASLEGTSESGDRRSLRLRPVEAEIIRAVFTSKVAMPLSDVLLGNVD